MNQDWEGTSPKVNAAAHAGETARLGMWVFLVTEALLFGGLFMTYTVFRIKYTEMFREQHLKLNVLLGTLNTVVLITSSLAVAIGIAALKRGRLAVTKLCLSLTILLGGVFLTIKYFEWSADFRDGLYPSSNIFFSLYFMMTGLHGLHVVGGMTVLTIMLVLTMKGRINEERSTPLEVAGIYWHFVDIVWIYLYPLLYLVG
jgi:cytochrome c oxidase subunit III